MIELCLICDRCCSVIAGGDTRRQIRESAKNLYQKIRGEDVCVHCVPLPHNIYKPKAVDIR